MDIRFVDVRTPTDRLKPEIEARIRAVLDHGQFILGPEIDELERELARYSGCRQAVAVASGTVALLVALMAEEVGPGDAVFLPAFTFTATAEMVVLLGAVPVFVDVDPRAFTIDPHDLAHKIEATAAAGGPRPKGIVAVDMFGLPADYAALAHIAEARGLFLMADAAQSFGASRDGKRVGSLASVTAVSFYPTKPLSGCGDGGAILTDDDKRAEVMRSIRVHGQGASRDELLRVGLNGRLDTIQAAILLAKLTILDEEIAARERLARLYDDGLARAVTTPARVAGTKCAWASYAIQVDDRDRVAEELREKGIPTEVYYRKPLHLQPPYARYGDGAGSLPVSEALSDRILSLPMHPYLDDKAGTRICDAVVSAVGPRQAAS
jgi:dTDP-4-amino-4,6-dideoxygalactose transaminase